MNTPTKGLNDNCMLSIVPEQVPIVKLSLKIAPKLNWESMSVLIQDHWGSAHPDHGETAEAAPHSNHCRCQWVSKDRHFAQPVVIGTGATAGQRRPLEQQSPCMEVGPHRSQCCSFYRPVLAVKGHSRLLSQQRTKLELSVQHFFPSLSLLIFQDAMHLWSLLALGTESITGRVTFGCTQIRPDHY